MSRTGDGVEADDVEEDKFKTDDAEEDGDSIMACVALDC